MIEMTMRDYVRVLFRQKWTIITSFITVVVTVGIGLILMTPVYEANVKILVSAEKLINAPYYRDLIGYQNTPVAMTQSEIVISNPVVERAVKVLGLYAKPLDYEKNFASLPRKAIIKLQAASLNKKLETLKPEQRQAYLYRLALEDLKKQIKVEPVRDTNIFTISIKDYSPVGAAILANVISRSYIIFDLEQQLSDMQMKYGEKNLAVTQLRESIAGMVKGLNGEPLPDVEAMGPASVKIIEQASMPIKPSGIPKVIIFILAVFMAVFLSVMLAFVFDYMDQTFKSPQELEAVLGMNCMGSIAKNRKKDAYEHIADQVCFEMKDRGLKSLLIAASNPREGVSTAIFHLAENVANKCRPKVLVIDANLRDPAIHKLFKIPNNEGLVDVLEGRSTLEKAAHKTVNNITILTSGKADMNPLTLIESNIMKELIHSAKAKYDVIFIDCSSLKNAKDAMPLSTYVDSAMIIVNEGKTRKHVAREMAISLGAIEDGSVPSERHKPFFLGAILANRTYPIPKWIYDRV